MGKTKKMKKKKEQGPTGLPSVRDAEEMELQQKKSQSGTLLSILEKLQCGGAEAKECACNTIASLISHAESVQALAENGVFRIVAPLLVDPSSEVRLSAVGALRNASVCGHSDICDTMVKQDVFTPLVSLLKQHYGNPQLLKKTESVNIKNHECGESSSKRKDADYVFNETFIHSVHLLWNLCEASSTGVKIFNRENLLPLLVPVLDYNQYGMDAAIAVGRCLHAVSEDNSTFAAMANSADLLPNLTKFLTSDRLDISSLLLKCLVIGIYLNVSGGKLDCKAMVPVMSILSRSVELDVVETVTVFVAKTKSLFKEETGVGDSKNPEFEVQLQELNLYLDVQQTALEIITNLCCVEESEDEEWEELDSSDASDIVECTDMEIEQGEPVELERCLRPELHEAIASNHFVEKILALLHPFKAELHSQLEQHELGKQFLVKHDRVRCRALLCINNMISNLTSDDFGGHDALWCIWSTIGTEIFQQTNITQVELLEATTCALRAVLLKLHEIKSTKFTSLAVDDIQNFFTIGRQCSEAAVRANIIRIMVTFGCLMATELSTRETLKAIGEFLLHMTTSDSSLWVSAEALDGIFDLFGEDDAALEYASRDIELVARLREIAPTFTSKINQERRTLGDHLPIVKTAKTNLMRFIKYKETRKAKQLEH